MILPPLLLATLPAIGMGMWLTALNVRYLIMQAQ
jgi:hypothetical protein